MLSSAWTRLATSPSTSLWRISFVSSKTDLKRSVRIPGVPIPEDAPIFAIVDDGRDLRVFSADGRFTRFEVGYAEEYPAILISTEEGGRRLICGGDIHHDVKASDRL